MVDEATLESAEGVIGYRFRDRGLLRQALTHASIADSRVESNERLEFLGDAVLGFLVCEYLHEHFEDLLEGDLTKIKSAVVSRQTCARVASEMGLDELLAIGKGMQTREVLPASLSAAVYESVTAAIYVDSGIAGAREFVVRTMEESIVLAAESGHQQNFKSVLQQYAQTHEMASPQYVLLDEQGPDHAKAFQVTVEIASASYPACWAQSKKRAEQLAALAALERLGLIVRDESGRVVYVPDDTMEAAG